MSTTKRITLNIPEFLTVEQYARMSSYKGDSPFGRVVHTVSALSGYSFNEVRQWDVDSLIEVSNQFAGIADHNNEFHPIIEWEGQLYGYAHMRQTKLGEYLDIEKLAKDLENNMHKLAALFYRPITKHSIGGLEFSVNQSIKTAKGDIEHVFDYYEIEKYDADTRRDREEQFKQFPVHIFLGALSFFLSTASLYLNHIAYSRGEITKAMKMTMEEEVLRNLSQNIGDGSLRFTNSLKPIYSQLQETQH